MFAASGVYIQMSPWPPPFMMVGRQGYGAALKMTLSQARLKCKKRMRTYVAWIQPHPQGAILRHFKYGNLVLMFFHQLS
jgi:hypothetical protein